RSSTSIPRTIRERSELAQLRNLQPVRFSPVLDRFLAAGERLGDGLEAHALGGELVELLNLVLSPGLAVAFEFFAVGHCPLSLPSCARLSLPREGGGYLTRSTCSNSNSTGVARPKMETDTFTRLRSKSSSSTMPLKLAKGPSKTFTLSPIS